ARNLDAPAGEILVDLELDRRVFDPAHLVDQLGEPCGPAAGLAAPDGPDRLALVLIPTLIDEESHRRVGRLSCPNVPLEAPDRDDGQVVEVHVAVVALPDVPGEDAVALILVRCLGEAAGTGHATAAYVEPIAADSPAGRFGHCLLHSSRGILY